MYILMFLNNNLRHVSIVYSMFQVYIRIFDNEWNVYRRYAEFRALHNHLRAKFPQVGTFSFPPKKAIGNKVSATTKSQTPSADFSVLLLSTLSVTFPSSVLPIRLHPGAVSLENLMKQV